MFCVPAIAKGKGSVTGGGAVAYQRTAFVSDGGNDGTAQLNDPALPFQTLNAAADILLDVYSGDDPVVIRVLNDLGDDLSTASVDALLAGGLTIMSHDAAVRFLTGNVSFGITAGSSLTLSKVVITTITKTAHVGVAVESAGSITLDAESSIGALHLSADPTAGSAGDGGATGASGTGTPNGPAQPPDGSPPQVGIDGGSFDATGATGGTGGVGNRAWNATLVGPPASIVNLIVATGGPGGGAGTGGGGGVATGGQGGQGANSNSGSEEAGANGGRGGDAIANGGNGGVGGIGGTGGTITVTGGVSILGNDLSGGVGGGGGGNGGAGTATAGVGGIGGSGSSGGGNGFSGSDGTATAESGGSGSTGATGASGSII